MMSSDKLFSKNAEFFRVLSFALTLIVSAGLALPSSAHAFILGDLNSLDNMNGPESDFVSGNTSIADDALCVLLLPLCILDQKTANVPGITKQDLLDNGYTVAEAAEIIDGSRELAVLLAKRRERLVVAKSDTQYTIAAEIRSVYPGASDVFADFYSSQAIATK